MREAGIRMYRDRSPKHAAVAASALLAGAVLLAACSTSATGSSSVPTSPGASTSPSVAGGTMASTVSAVVRGIQHSADATFSVTYKITVDQNQQNQNQNQNQSQSQNQNQSQTITFAQAPPKSAVVTPAGSFYIDGSSVTGCQGSGSTATCTTLPTSMTGALTSLTGLFSPATLSSTLKGYEAESLARAAGVSVTTSSTRYGGLASTCFTLRGPSQSSAVTYCAANSNGILTYSSAAGYTVTLTAYSANPPASTFSPPT